MEVVLVKTPDVFEVGANNRSMIGERVVGIRADACPTISEYGYQPTDQATEEALELGDAMAGRLLLFYERCRAAAPEDRPFYNCHVLAHYITGAAPAIRQYSRFYSDPVPHADQAILQPGQTYGVETAAGYVVHGCVGIERPNYTVSVLDNYGPMAILHNNDLLQGYDAQRVRPVSPRQALC